MRALRLVLALALLALAALALVAAHDVRAWRSAFERGDARLDTHPATATWRASTILPGDPVRSIAEIALSDVAARGAAAPASQAGNLLGVLVIRAGTIIGRVTPDDRARAAWEAAIRRDPSNTDAKYNLELLLRRTRATSTRQGPGNGSGALGHGRRGAGSGTPGRGY